MVRFGATMLNFILKSHEVREILKNLQGRKELFNKSLKYTFKMSEPLLLTQTLIAYCPEHSSGLSPSAVAVEAKYIPYTPRSEYFLLFPKQ